MGQHWRLILDGNRGAAMNMAVDEAIMQACAKGDSPPTLRLYGWEQPSVSLGCFQRIEHGGLDVDYCRESGIQLVRRPTGGRAVLHGHDLTFSIAMHESCLSRESRSILGSHRWLMAGILRGLSLLGVHAEIGPDGVSRPGRVSGADCFAHVADCDVRVGQGKVAGAAQARRNGALLEQGSLPYTIPAVDSTRIFGGNAAIVADLLMAISRQELERAIPRGFEQSLQVEFEPGTLAEPEVRLASELSQGKYSPILCKEGTKSPARTYASNLTPRPLSETERGVLPLPASGRGPGG